MTKHTCDACGKEMDAPVIAAIPGVIFRVDSFEHRHNLQSWEFCVTDYRTSPYEYSAAPLALSTRGKLDGIAICHDCMLSAFKKAVAELK